MKILATLSVFLFALMSFVHAAEHADAGSPAPTKTTQYLIGLSEYELEQAVPMGLSETEIVSMICDSKITPVRTVRMTAVEGVESIVNFGRRVTVAAGEVVDGRNISVRTVSHRTENLDIGTILNVRIVPHDDGAMANISYSTTHLDSRVKNGSQPDVLTGTVETTQIYTLGKERVLSVTSSDTFTCILVSVSELR